MLNESKSCHVDPYKECFVDSGIKGSSEDLAFGLVNRLPTDALVEQVKKSVGSA